MDKLILIDGNSLLNRAFYATPVFSTKSGLPTNGIFGFIKLMLKIISDEDPKYMVVAFDLHAPTFRHKMYKDYKGGRKAMPEDLVKQVPVLKECLSAMNITICEKEGYEADDILGTLSACYDVHSIVYTGDRDAYQLVDEKTDVFFTKRGVSDLLRLTKNNFKEEIGLIPEQIIELKSLMGDSSDNIPGVKGVGEKSARTLLEKYSTLDGVYEHIDEIKGSLQQKLIQDKDNAFFSRTLATIDRKVPLDLQLDDCKIVMPFSEKVKKMFAELEFRTLLSLPIFSKEEEKDSLQEEEITITSEKVNDLSRFIEEIENYSTIYFDWDKELHLFFNEKEYILSFKENLLDNGFLVEELLPLFKKLFENSNKKIIVYRYKNLWHQLKKMGIEWNADFEDISVLKYLIDYTGKDEELDFLQEYYGYEKEDRAFALKRLYDRYFKILNEEKEEKLYTEMEKPLCKILCEMEEQGVCVNLSLLDELGKKYEEELNGLREKIYALAKEKNPTIEKFNINSSQQLSVVLFEKLGLKGGKKSKVSGNYSTSADILEKLAEENEIVRCILRYRTLQKLHSTYIEGLRPLIKNGKVHTTYNQVVTTTGRLSSSNPNLQNIPARTEEGKELRKLFKAEEGHLLIDADYSQIELRLLAHFSNCKELIEAYNSGKDIHALTASQVFNVPIEQVTSLQRRRAKAVNFGIIYGISAFGLSNGLDITPKQGAEFIEKYFAAYSDVKKYMDSNVEFAKKNGYVSTLFGRKRIINELNSSNFNVRSFGERAAMNMPLQGTSADIIKVAMVKVAQRLKEENLKTKMILQVHDELVLDAPKEEVEKASRILKECMENAVQLHVPLTVEVSTGESWYDAK